MPVISDRIKLINSRLATCRLMGATCRLMGDPCLCLALTVAQLYARPALIAAAKTEFDKSRGAGFVYKPLIGDQPPPLDYRKPSHSAMVDPG